MLPPIEFGCLLMPQMLWAHRRALLAEGPAGIRNAVSALLRGAEGVSSCDDDQTCENHSN